MKCATFHNGPSIAKENNVVPEFLVTATLKVTYVNNIYYCIIILYGRAFRFSEHGRCPFKKSYDLSFTSIIDLRTFSIVVKEKLLGKQFFPSSMIVATAWQRVK